MADNLIETIHEEIYDPVYTELLRLQQVCKDKHTDSELGEEIDKCIKLFREKYCENITSKQFAPLAAIELESRTHPFAEAYAEGMSKWRLQPIMLSGEYFLQSIVSMSRVKTVLDIGMFTGYAALACAEVLPVDGEVVTCEFDPYLEDVARELFNNCPAKDTLLDLAKENRQFDIVFIDANKDGYLEYYQIIMEKGLLAENGTILFDNALYKGLTYKEDLSSLTVSNPSQLTNGLAIRKLNDGLKSQDNMHKVMVPIRDGVLMVRRTDDMYTA